MSSMHTIAALSVERQKAKAALELSSTWSTWKESVTASASSRGEAPAPSAPLPLVDPTPEDVLRWADDGFDEWDAQDPVVKEHKRVQQLLTERSRSDELKQRVEESPEWRAVIELNRQLRALMTEEITQLRQSLLLRSKPATTTAAPQLPAALQPTTDNEAAACSPSPQPSQSQTNGTAEPIQAPGSASVTPPSAPIKPPSAFSPFKRDLSAKLKMPHWCAGIEPDLYQPVSEHGLGLLDAAVYQQMCGSERNQVQRIWSRKEDGSSLLAAVLRAQEFQVDNRFEPPSSARARELCESLWKAASVWSDDEMSKCVPEFDPKKTTKEQFLEMLFCTARGQADAAVLHIYHAVHPTAPRVYLIGNHAGVSANAQQPQLSLHIVGKDLSPPTTRCIVLFQNLSHEPVPHVEALGWKRGARGPSPLKSVFDFSENIIRSLEAWYLHRAAISLLPPNDSRNKKRARDEKTEQASVSSISSATSVSGGMDAKA